MKIHEGSMNLGVSHRQDEKTDQDAVGRRNDFMQRPFEL